MTRVDARATAEEAVEQIAEATGTVLLVGAPDTGKSTLALAAGNAAVRTGRRVIIVDTDLGQGEVGPPGVMGSVCLTAPAAALSELRPRNRAFVGDITPRGHTVSVVSGLARLTEQVHTRSDRHPTPLLPSSVARLPGGHTADTPRAALVLVDTSGLVEGRAGEELKLSKAAVLDPALIVILERDGELHRLRGLFRHCSTAELLSVRTAPEARRKTPAYRKLMREIRLRKHFATARVHDLDVAALRTFGTWLFTGEALPAGRLHAAARALGFAVPYGERTPDGVFLCVQGQPERNAAARLEEEFRRERVYLTPAECFQGLLVGLGAPGGRLVEVGLLRGINFERALISVLTPARSLEDVGLMQFGRLRVRPDGTEIARLRPGDL